MKYIFDDNHKWTVVFGVPCGTSFCQVVDSTEQNGIYKIHIVKAKHEILTHRIEHIIGEIEPIPTDIIPLIDKAWVNSFAELEYNNKSIAKRG